MKQKVDTLDKWLTRGGPVAVVVRENLMPVEGDDGVVFPPTFAAAEDKSKFPGGYNVDVGANGSNVCIIDTVGSQANRMEPVFAEAPYRDLVPQVVIKAGSREINLLDAGHRAGDAIVRCTELQAELKAAFEAALRGNAEPLARIAPTSIVFGVWDSRDTQAKMPRLVSSTIRAFDVSRLTRAAQYIPAVEYVNEELLDDTDNKTVRDAYAQRGFSHVPSSGAPGGVIAKGGIRRDATLSLAALQQLTAGNDADRTLALRRYILGLSLVAFTQPGSGYLRQGCNLVCNPEKPSACEVVYRDGRRERLALTHEEAIAYATEAANAFGVAAARAVEFDKKRATAEVVGDTSDDKAAKKTKKK
jgi:CRISPR-associated protein Csb1